MRKTLQPLRNENGMVLVATMMILSTLILLGSTAVMLSTTDLKIAGNYKTGSIALYSAEAGSEVGRERLRGGSANNISDSGQETSYTWSQSFSATGSVSYAVTIVHKTNPASSTQPLYASYVNGGLVVSTTRNVDSKNIYLISSTGTSSTARRVLETTVTKLLPVPGNAALSVQAPTTLQGNSTYINGTDTAGCGSNSLPGVATTMPTNTVTGNGSPTVCGAGALPGCVPGSGGWSVTGGAPVIDVPAIIENLKSSANYSYSHNGNVTNTGMDWGVPTVASQTLPSTCNVSNIVYYDMHGNDLKLAGGSSGCGILMVDGDLELNGGFNWYGPIYVTGSVTIAGGGNKNITGSVIAGGSTEADLVGGNVSIVYCSKALNDAADRAPLRRLSWTEN